MESVAYSWSAYEYGFETGLVPGCTTTRLLHEHEAAEQPFPIAPAAVDCDMKHSPVVTIGDEETASERLMISTNTAADHVCSILMKTGVNSRTQAAVLAANAGLLT